jgi:glutaredoxin
MSIANTIIGADYCPYCVKVKAYFEEKNIPFEWIDSLT